MCKTNKQTNKALNNPLKREIIRTRALKMILKIKKNVYKKSMTEKHWAEFIHNGGYRDCFFIKRNKLTVFFVKKKSQLYLFFPQLEKT